MQTRFIKTAAECGICFHPVHFKGELDCCIHSFCLDCIQRWSEVTKIQTENSCPTCKSRFKTITRIPQRLEYNHRSTKNLIYVNHKSQKIAIPLEDIISLINIAERMVEEEVGHLLHRLQRSHRRTINTTTIRRILSNFRS